MKMAAQVLLTVANELAEKAKSSLPNLRGGEEVTREWFDNAVYHRETIFENKLFHVGYDFRKTTVI